MNMVGTHLALTIYELMALSSDWSVVNHDNHPASQQSIVLDKPDTLLLDVALFQATNEARRLEGLAPLQYDWGLYRAASNHAESMMRYNYTSHEDLYKLDELTLLKRVQKQTNRFSRIGENIGRYQTINNGSIRPTTGPICSIHYLPTLAARGVCPRIRLGSVVLPSVDWFRTLVFNAFRLGRVINQTCYSFRRSKK